MTRSHLSTAAVVWLLTRTAARRLVNQMTGGPRRKPKRRHRLPLERVRTGTGRKGGASAGRRVLWGILWAFLMLVAFAGTTRLVSQIVTFHRLVDPDASTAVGAPVYVSEWTLSVLQDLQSAYDQRPKEERTIASHADLLNEVREHYQGVLCGWDYVDGDFELKPTTPSQREQIDALVQRFDRLGPDGFRIESTSLFPEPPAWPSGETEQRVLATLSVVLALLCLSLLMMPLGMSNQDLGRIVWSFEWLFTMPARTSSLLTAKLLEYTVIHPAAWMTLWPLSTAILHHRLGGWAYLGGLGLALAMMMMLAAFRLTIETFVRLKLPLQTVKNLQAAGTVLGMVPFYIVIYLAMQDQPPSWYATLSEAAPLVTYLPSNAPGLLANTDLAIGVTATGILSVLLGITIGAVLLCSHLLRRGVLSSSTVHSGRRGPLTEEPARRRFAPSGVLAKELRLFLRDRNFMVQTAVVPLVIIAFNVLINPHWLEGASQSIDHASTLAFGIGAYSVLASGLAVIHSEGKALWMLYTLPHSIGDLLRHKVRLWACLGIVYTLGMMVALIAIGGHSGPGAWLATLMAATGVAIYAFVAAGLGVLGADPLAQETSKRVKPTMVYLYLVLASLYSYGLYAAHWWEKLTLIALCALLAYAIWQKVRNRIPYLLDPTAAPPPSLDLSDGLIAALCFFVAQGVVLAITVARLDDGETLQAEHVTVAFLIAGLTVYLTMAAVFKIKDIAWYRITGSYRGAHGFASSLGLGVGLGVVTGGLGIGYLELAPNLPWVAEMLEQAAQNTLSRGHSEIWIAVLAVVFAPIFEEFIFRGLIFRSLERTLALPWAILGSAAVFTMVHPPLSWAPVFGLGVATAWVTARTGTITAATILHGVYNALVVSWDSTW